MLPAPPVTTHVFPVMIPTILHPLSRAVLVGRNAPGTGGLCRMTPVYGMLDPLLDRREGGLGATSPRGGSP
jgi:hypothetical protein